MGADTYDEPATGACSAEVERPGRTSRPGTVARKWLGEATYATGLAPLAPDARGTLATVCGEVV